MVDGLLLLSMTRPVLHRTSPRLLISFQLTVESTAEMVPDWTRERVALDWMVAKTAGCRV